MANYIIQATEQLICMMLVLGMTFAYSSKDYGKTVGRTIFRVGVIAGIAAGAIMSYLKNGTNKIDTGSWNFWIYLITIISFIAFIVFTKLEKKIGKIPSAVCLAVMIFMLLFYSLPDFLATPFQIYVAETTFFSSSYIIKLSGFVIGFILTLVACFASNRMSRRFEANHLFWFLVVAVAINEVLQLSRLVNIMITRRIIASNHALFQFVKFGNNHSNLFIYLIMAVFVVMGVILIARSAHVNEPYSNPAQHRKIRAKWRNIRRWSTTAFICVACSVVIMTVVNNIANAETQLSPTEDCDVIDGQVVIPFDRVDDGHLHRFGYTTKDNIQVRFIVIQKPNSTTYGVGMDACDICGQTGYYENGNGEVVCNRCDVVMNINTIGFKGGCNPKVFDYTIKDKKIYIPVEGLEQYEDDFK